MELEKYVISGNRMLNRIPIGFVVINQDDEVIFINRFGQNELNIEEAEIPGIYGRKITDVIRVLYKGEDCFQQLKQKAIESEKEVDFPEISYLNFKQKKIAFPVTGILCPFSPEGEINEEGYMLCFRDITEELTHEYMLQTAISQTTIYPWSFDVEYGLFTLESRYFEYVGIEPGPENTLTMERYVDMIHPDDRENMAKAFTVQLGEGIHETPVPFRLRKGDGTWEWFEGQSLKFLEKSSGRPYRLIGMCMSIQSFKDSEAMRIKMLKAEESDKLKSAFLANMSHEIRTPLNAIVGFSDLLIHTADEKERADYIQIITTNNDLLLKLIDDILDLSKIEAGSVDLKYENFDLAEYFNNLFPSMKQRVIRNSVRLYLVNPFPACYVSLDKNRLAQIMINYVTNAIKYTPKGFIEMGYERVPEGIRLFVKDSGIGIAEDKREKVFHRFEKLDEFAQGTGLGLSICKAIAESMGGSVGFHSEFGEGSEFWAILPCDVEVKTEEKLQNAVNNEQQTVTGTKPDETSGNNLPVNSDHKTILVAEDIDSNYLLISALLCKDYELLHAVNGLEAVAMAKAKPLDLILMDIKMPEMDGITATSEIRKFNRDIPIIILTAHAFEADREAASSAGCNEYLVKPLNRDKLITTLKKY